MARRTIDDITDPAQKRIAKNLKANCIQIRTSKDLRQTDVADKCDLSSQHVADVEQGKTGNPRLETVCQLAIGLGVKDPLDLLKKPKKDPAR